MNSTKKIIIGTRGSELALWQSNWIAAELRRLHPSFAIETTVIKTTGDKILDSPLSKIGDKGLFTKEIENALLDDSIDLAVHSLKDVPTKLAGGLMIGAITEREDVRDVFISHPKRTTGRSTPSRKTDRSPPGACGEDASFSTSAPTCRSSRSAGI